MNTNVLSRINKFSDEFVSTIIDGNDKGSNKYEWQLSFYMYYVEQDLIMETSLFLYDNEFNELVGNINYEIIRNRFTRYTYITTFAFDETVVIDNVIEKIEVLKDIINSRHEGLYDKMCEYLHIYTMEQMEYGEDVDEDNPPRYKDIYSPSRISLFMKKYGISPYVPIVIEVVDDEGLPSKYLSIKDLGFNDESNNLIIFVKE